jgi:PAS domain S-box-containing protein
VDTRMVPAGAARMAGGLSFHIVALWAGAVVSAGLVAYGWRHREAAGGRGFVVMMAAVAAHTTAQALRVHTDVSAFEVVLVKLSFAGQTVAIGAFLAFAIVYTGRGRWLRHPLVLLILGALAASVLLAATNEWHGLMFRGFGWARAGWRPSPGPLLLVHGLIALTASLIAQALFVALVVQAPAFYRGQTMAVAFAGFLPVLAVLTQLALPDWASSVPPIALGFAAMGLAMAVATRHFGVLDVVPVARDVVFTRMSDAIVVLDNLGRIVDLNAEAATLVGLPLAQAIGRASSEVFREQPELARLAADALPGEYELALTSAEGTHHYVVRVSRLPGVRGETTGAAVVLHDITARKEAEEALRKAHEELQALAKLRDDLTGMIVHDLRTPLTSTITGLRTMEVMGELDEDQRGLLAMSIQGGETLVGMINDLLDISKMEDGLLQLERRRVAPADLVASACEQVAALAAERGHEVRTEIDAGLPEVEVDEDLIRRSLVNLLGNAIKFTPDGGTITVAAALAGEDPEIRFSVTDTGEGIPEESFGRIFEKFGQVEERKAGRKMSTGLGLTLCKLAVEAHGGRVWVESTLGQGTTFSLTLPIAAS